jgi:outer membrane biosynthesis protein TonB
MGSPFALRRPFGRLLGASASAIVASILLHGGAAALALLVLPRVMARQGVSPQEDAPAVVDINVVAPEAPEEPREPERRPQSAPLPRAPRRAAPRAQGAVVAPQAPPSPAPAESEPTPTSSDEDSRAVVPRFPRFALSAGSIAGRADSPDPGAGTQGHGLADATIADAAAPLPESAVDVPARIASAAPPPYPESARRAELELDLPLELVVSPQGRVVSALALGHPGYGLEEAALTAVRSYLFHPARRAGRAVLVRMKWTMQFRLH